MKDLDGIEVAPARKGRWRIERWFAPSEIAMMTHVAEKRGLSAGECLVHLHRKVASVKQAAERENNVFGRAYNSLTGERGDIVTLPGHVLQLVFRLTGKAATEGVDLQVEYALELAVAEQLLEALRAEAAA